VTNQFYTICKRCGRQILMTKTEQGWMPCHPEVMRFRPAGGPCTFVNEDGKVCRGERVFGGGEIGYEKHWRHCVA